MAWVHYARDVDPTDINNAHTLAGLLVPAGARVLDVGVGAGAVARFLSGRGCQVWGVEIDREAARHAERWCVRVVNADVETLDVDAEFGDECFETVLCLDVLEHLKDPVGALRRMMRRLSPGGQVVISLPNVTHASVRLQILQGRFPRTDAGLLDRSHLQFFDRAGALQLIADAGLRVVQDLRVVKRPEETELPNELGRLGEEILDAATDGADATTYQFIFVAVPEEDAFAVGAPALSTVLQQRLNEQLALAAEAARWARALEQRHAELQGEAAGLRQALVRAEADRDAAIAEATTAREEVRKATAASAGLEQRLDQLLERIDTAAARVDAVAHLHERIERAEHDRAAAATELAYDREVAAANQQRQERLDRRAHDLTVALVVREQEIARLQAAVADERKTLAGLTRQVTFLQNDRIVKDAFVSDLRQRLLEATAAADEARARCARREMELAEAMRRTDDLAAELAASAAAADTARATARELEDRLHQPRHLLADRMNSRVKRWTLLHRALKAWLGGPRRQAGRQ